MKNILKPGVLLGCLLFLTGLMAEVMADPPNPPVVPGSHGQGGNINGAPLDGTLGILLLLAGAAYGGWVLLKRKKKSVKKAHLSE